MAKPCSDCAVTFCPVDRKPRSQRCEHRIPRMTKQLKPEPIVKVMEAMDLGTRKPAGDLFGGKE